jgi:hypothetical protein
VGENDTAKSSVINLEYSPEISNCFTEGTSPVLEIATVGNASSSATPGSSMASVAGNMRLPTISWLRAAAVTSTAAALQRAAYR